MGLAIFECARVKVIGKPYEGKLHVRFDEGVVDEESTTLLYYSVSFNSLSIDT